MEYYNKPMRHADYKQLHRSRLKRHKPAFPGIHLTFTGVIGTTYHANELEFSQRLLYKKKLLCVISQNLSCQTLHFHLPFKQDCRYGIIDLHKQRVWADEIMYGTLHFRQQTQFYLNVWIGILEFRLLYLSPYRSDWSCVPRFATKHPPKAIAKYGPPYCD